MREMLKRKSWLEKRRRKIDRELSLVARDIRVLSKTLERPGTVPDLSRLRSRGAGVPETGAKTGGPPGVSRQGPTATPPETGNPLVRDARFSGYLASSLQPTRPLRHERKVQRNKAIVMLVSVLVVLLWLLLRFFL